MTSDWKNPSADAIALRLTSKIDRLYPPAAWPPTSSSTTAATLSPSADRAPSIAAAAQLIANYQPTSKFVTLEAWV